MTTVVARTPRARRVIAGGAAVLAGLGMAVGLAPTADALPPGTDTPGVTANFFEWNWPSVAKECTDVLGPAGYSGVQVSPPQDSLRRTKLGNGSDTVLHPWWEVYQPVRYALTSRMGDEAQFQSMVSTCRAAGVKVYVDAVINHMTGQGQRSYGGVKYSKYSYDGLYTSADFHVPAGECPSASGDIEDFNNIIQVFRCELVSLSDLRTQTDTVRATLQGYLNKLLSYGVSGFRVDAAKHIGQTDLDAIYAGLDDTVDGTRPYWALEVFNGGPGSISTQGFLRSGDVLGLDGVTQIRNAFISYTNGGGSIAVLKDFGIGSGLTPSDQTLSFVTNHDTERGYSVTYKDGATWILANAWLLASGYGHPQVFSGFAFGSGDAGNAQGPPSTAKGFVRDTDCDSPAWNCTDRNAVVRAMVGFADHVGSAVQRNWYDDGDNVIAFSRGAKGWVAFNNGTTAQQVSTVTGLRPGSYVDLVSGSSVTVDSAGGATVTVPAKGAVALRSDKKG